VTAHALPLPASATAASDGARLFVVDRDPFARRLIEQFLAGSFAIETFSDGYEALDAARKAPPIGIVTEILLSRLDGLTLCRLLKSDPVTSSVRIVVSSALASRERAIAAGANDFLLKPLEKTRVVSMVQSLMEKRSDVA
jgi:CheY-like chemotaxis protein